LAQDVSQDFKERNMSDEWQPIEALPKELKESGRLLWLRRGDLQAVGWWSNFGWIARDKETKLDFEPSEWKLY